MNTKRSPIPRALLILVVVGAMAAAVWTVGERLRHGDGTVSGAVAPAEMPVHEVLHQGVAHDVPTPRFSTPLLTETTQDVNQRTIATYYARRAYPGAPPMVPHPVAADGSMDRSCGTCHERGGFAAKYNAYAPVTPHPEYGSCTQCHVPQVADGLFAATTWVAPEPPDLHRPALPGGPPPIPHTLQLRNNCLAGHAGPAAPLDIRTTHPERRNCTQCHVPQGMDALSGFRLLALFAEGDR